jgi:hypothetical protein
MSNTMTMGADASVAPQKEVVQITRRLLVQVKGTMDNFNRMGTEAATWKPVNGKMGEVFGVHDCFESVPDAGTTAGVLQNAIIHKITLLEQKNEFPVHLGVNISCITPEETTRTGHKYAVTSLANSHSQFPLVVFEAGEHTDGIEWRNKYPQYNAMNLDTQGVLQVTGENYVFCSKDHPAIDVLRQNHDIINSDIDQHPLIDGSWYKIQKPVFSMCCDALRKRVLTSVPTRDLNNFHVQISRLNRDDWTTSIDTHDELMCAVPPHVLASGDELEIGQHIKGLIDQPNTWSGRLEVTYEVTV